MKIFSIFFLIITISFSQTVTINNPKNGEKIMTFFHVLVPEKEIHVFVNSFESGSVPSGFNILVDDKYIFV